MMAIPGEEETDFRLFLQESKELLARFQEISPLLKGPIVPSIYLELHRVFHSWKGLTKTLGFPLLPDLFNNLAVMSQNLADNRIDQAKEVQSFLTTSISWLPELIPSKFGAAVDDSKIKQYLNQIQSIASRTKTKDSPQDILKERKLFLDLGLNQGDFLSQSVSGGQFYSIAITIDETLLKKTRIYTILRNLKLQDNHLQFLRISPPLDDILNNRFDCTFQIDIKTTNSPEKLKDFFLQSLNIKEFHIGSNTNDMAIPND